MKSLPVFVSLVSLAFAVDGFAQTPAGGASQGALPVAKSTATSTITAVVAVGVAAVAAVATSNSTTSGPGTATAATNH